MGDVTDQTTLEKGSLVVKKRSITQGPMAIDLSFDNNKATGTMARATSRRRSMPTSAACSSPTAPARHEVIAALPLAEGYETTFRNFNLQTQKVDDAAAEGGRRRAGHRARRHVHRVEDRGVERDR